MIEQNLAEFVAFLSHQKRCSAHSVEAYSRDLKAFFLFLDAQEAWGGERSLPAIRTAHIRLWMRQLGRAKAQAATIRRKLSAVKSFLAYMYKQGKIKTNPAVLVQVVHKPRHLVHALTLTQTQTLFALPHAGVPHPSSPYMAVLSETVLRVLYQTGIRRAELLDLRQNNIDLHNHSIRVLGKGNRERILPISVDLATRLRAYVALREQYFPNIVCGQTGFWLDKNGRPLRAAQVYTIVRKALTCVSSAPKRSPHVLRHTFATQLLNEGADIHAIQHLLGHSTLAATQIYTGHNISHLRSIYQKSHPKA